MDQLISCQTRDQKREDFYHNSSDALKETKIIFFACGDFNSNLAKTWLNTTLMASTTKDMSTKMEKF